MEFKRRVKVDAVQVDTAGIGPVVATYNAVGIQHRHQLEDILSPQLDGTSVVFTKDEVKESVEDTTARSFAGMNPATKEEHLQAM